MYFRSYGTQNTLYTLESLSSNSNEYATSPTLWITRYDPMYLGISFLAIPNLTTPLVGEARRNT